MFDHIKSAGQAGITLNQLYQIFKKNNWDLPAQTVGQQGATIGVPLQSMWGQSMGVPQMVHIPQEEFLGLKVQLANYRHQLSQEKKTFWAILGGGCLLGVGVVCLFGLDRGRRGK